MLPHTTPPRAAERQPSVLLIGDSMGEGLEPHLRTLFGARNYITRWKRGTTTKYWTAQDVARTIRLANPDVVIFALGTNDAHQRKTPQESAINARQLIQAAGGRTVLWAGQPDSPRIQDYGTAKAIAEAVIGTGGRYFDTKELALRFYDGIHPYPDSFKTWGKALYGCVRNLIASPAPARG